ncbi:MAG: hypothetical protein QMC78_05840 [Methanocellales archaeon]|nr:hypothetical protein [Methanocellales archaeon]
MNKYLEILLGLVLVVLGAYGIYYFLGDVLTFIKGVVGIVVLVVGIIILAIGILELKE